MPRFVVAALLFTAACRPHLAGPPNAIAPAETREGFLIRRAQERGVSLGQQQAWDRRHGADAPAAADLTDLARATEARSLFAQHCAGCHGARGEGIVGAVSYPALGGFGFRMGMTMSGGKMAAGVFRLVAEGRGKMPGFGDKLANEQLWALVALIRAMPLR